MFTRVSTDLVNRSLSGCSDDLVWAAKEVASKYTAGADSAGLKMVLEAVNSEDWSKLDACVIENSAQKRQAYVDLFDRLCVWPLMADKRGKQRKAERQRAIAAKISELVGELDTDEFTAELDLRHLRFFAANFDERELAGRERTARFWERNDTAYEKGVLQNINVPAFQPFSFYLEALSAALRQSADMIESAEHTVNGNPLHTRDKAHQIEPGMPLYGTMERRHRAYSANRSPSERHRRLAYDIAVWTKEHCGCTRWALTERLTDAIIGPVISDGTSISYMDAVKRELSKE